MAFVNFNNYTLQKFVSVVVIFDCTMHSMHLFHHTNQSRHCGCAKSQFCNFKT